MQTSRSYHRSLPLLLALAVSGTALAHQPPMSGLGQSWPNAADSSRNPHFHAYVFMIDGIKYVQINDANGNVLGAVGTANGQVITLPMGRYAHQVRSSKPASAMAPNATPATVYQDADTQVDVTSLGDGSLQLSVSLFCGDPESCSTHFL